MPTKTQDRGHGTEPTKTTGDTLFSPLVIILGTLLVLQILASLALGFGMGKSGPAESTGPLLVFDPEQVTGIRVRTPEKEPVQVTKTADGWIIPSLADLPAAEHKVTTLLTKLEGLRKGLPVATSEAALKRFKVSDQTFERKLTLEVGDAPPVVLYLGDSPGFRHLFVRAEGDGAIYEAELGLYDAPDRADGWSDRTLLHLDPEAIRQLTFAGLALERTDDGWQLADLTEGEEQDQVAVEDRVRTLTNIDFLSTLAGKQEAPAPDTEADPIEFEAVLTDGEAIRYRITKFAEGDSYLLEASNRPQSFKLAGYEVEDLTDRSRADLLKKLEETTEGASTASPPAMVDKGPEQETVEEASSESAITDDKEPEETTEATSSGSSSAADDEEPQGTP